jgi:hypothetical protein
MRNLYAMSAASMTAAMLTNLSALSHFEFNEPADFRKPKTYKTGKRYPHSSKRQNERFARQLAAGKVTFQDGSHLSEATRKG